MKTMKENPFIGWYDVAVIIAWFVGVIGGFGSSLYAHNYFIAVCVLALGAEAFPYVYSRFKDLI